MSWSGAGKLFLAGVGILAFGFAAGSLAATPAQGHARSKKAPVAAQRPARTSFNFNNIPVRSALQLIAEEGRFNLIVSDSVQGNISLRLNEVTWEQALALVLRIKGLQQHVDGNTRSVAATGG
jgi:type IV pilus assembly protein PilQ